MATRTIVVLGGAQAGPAAALAARDADNDARILLLERASHVAYAVGGLAYGLSGEVPRGRLSGDAALPLLRARRVEVRCGAEVRAIDAGRRRVHLAHEVVPFTALVYALGAESLVPAVPGLEAARNVFRFRTPRDLDLILSRLRRGARHVSILGGGFFGLEAADGFLRRGCRVTVLERGGRLLPRFTAATARLAAGSLERAGARVLTGTRLLEAECRKGEVRALRLADGSRLQTDLLVVAIGLRPRTGLLAEAGARVRPDGALVIDSRCVTSLPRIYACGVCVAVPQAVSGRSAWFAQAAQAERTARVAGTNAAGGRAELAGMLGSAVLRVGELTIARTGLTRDEARTLAAEDYGSVSVEAPSCEPFFPGSSPLRIELFFERRRGRVLGAELAGRVGADKRADALAAAICGGLTVRQLAQLDLAYAPPFSTARDVLNVAAAEAMARLRRRRSE